MISITCGFGGSSNSIDNKACIRLLKTGGLNDEDGGLTINPDLP
jgi:hypothetical protein